MATTDRFVIMMGPDRFASLYPQQLSGRTKHRVAIGPGWIVAEERITLDRPRDVSSPAFNDIRRHLASCPHADHLREAA